VTVNHDTGGGGLCDQLTDRIPQCRLFETVTPVLTHPKDVRRA